MADDVKRPYDNSRRLAQSRATRAQVVAAARKLFVDAGYATTTIESIGDAAGVPLATIYRLFGSKLGILRSVIDVTFGGDDEPVAFGDRPEVRAALAEPDPDRLLDAFAPIARQLMDRSAPLMRVLASAAEVDPEAAGALDEVRRQRITGQSRIADALAKRGALREGLTKAEAADIVYAFMSPDMHHLLTVERGWSADRYERWLGEGLKAVLLPPTTRRRPQSSSSRSRRSP
jgi:AcrR family transcriptional regulator